jgi:hypothetical protein
MKKKFAALTLSFVLWGACSADSIAADFSKKIPAGASFGEVLGIWGEPIEKVEKSVKREVVWHYTDGARVVFRDGRVRSWQPTKAILAVKAQEEAAKASVAVPAGAELSGETRDLVRDIAKEVPSGPDGPSSDSAPSAANVGQPPLIPNHIPPGGRGAPPGVAPGEVVLDDDIEED